MIRGLLGLTLILLHLTSSLYCKEPEYDSIGRTFGNPPKEVDEVIGRARRNPEVLREFRHLPLESTFEILRQLMQTGYASNSEATIRVATEVLSTHPQLEDFLAKHTGYMAKLLEPEEPPSPLDNYANKQRDVAFHTIAELISSARFLQGDGAFRVVGPRLFDRSWKRDYGDSSASSHSYAAVANLIWLIKERLPNAPVPKDLEECRVWWKANAERFAKKPEKPQLANAAIAAATIANTPVEPNPFRVAVPQPSQPIVEKDHSSMPRFVVLGGALLLLLVGAFALWATQDRALPKA